MKITKISNISSTLSKPAAIILRRGSEAAEAGGVVRLLPQDDRLLRHVEVVLTQLVLGP